MVDVIDQQPNAPQCQAIQSLIWSDGDLGGLGQCRNAITLHDTAQWSYQAPTNLHTNQHQQHTRLQPKAAAQQQHVDGISI